jgi:high-affinity iron transporter
MVASFLLGLREGLEAALILGIVLGVLGKIGRLVLKPAVWWGAATAVMVSAAAAWGLTAVGFGLSGLAEQIYEGAVMLLAAIILTWMIFWMRRQGKTLNVEMERQARRASFNGWWGLAILAFVAVMREGIELALFLAAAQAATGAVQTWIGALLGILSAAGLGWLLFNSTRRLNIRQFFLVTNVLLLLFAAGMVGLGVHELNEANVIPVIVEHVWDINGFVDEKSSLGIVLRSLLGYNGNPSLSEVVAYLGYLLALLSALVLPRRKAGKIRVIESLN